jgi:protein ATS1
LDLSTLGGEAVDGGRKGKGKAVARPTTYPPTTLHLPLGHAERIIDISLGSSHSLVLTSQGRVLAWGSNQKGQITSTTELKTTTAISASWGGSYFTTSTGQLLSQGSNIYSQLLHGSEHLLCVLKCAGELGLWVGGWNEHGNLGLGDLDDRAELTRVHLEGRIKGVWGGCASTWVWVE